MYVAARSGEVGVGVLRRRRYSGTVGERIWSREEREETSVVEEVVEGKGIAGRALRDSLLMVTGRAKRALSEAKAANAFCRSADAGGDTKMVRMRIDA
jgi:hypothetical protein